MTCAIILRVFFGFVFVQTVITQCSVGFCNNNRVQYLARSNVLCSFLFYVCVFIKAGMLMVESVALFVAACKRNIKITYPSNRKQANSASLFILCFSFSARKRGKLNQDTCSGTSFICLLIRLTELYFLYSAVTSASAILSRLSDVQSLCFIYSQPHQSFAGGNAPIS